MQQKLSEMQVSYKRPNTTEQCTIRSSQDAFTVLLRIWNPDTISLYEEFAVLFLDRKNEVLGYRWIARGTVSACLVNTKLILSIGLLCNCSSIILAHNHPSGGTEPSKADLTLTNKITKAGKLLDIKILDHLIITPDSYSSFCDDGLIDST